MLLLIFSSCVTNFTEEKCILANFDLLNSCKKMPPALAHLKNADGFVQKRDSLEKVADIALVSVGQDGKGSYLVRLQRF